MNFCLDGYGKNVPVIQSVIYCFGCEGKGGRRLNKFLAFMKGFTVSRFYPGGGGTLIYKLYGYVPL